MNNTHNIKPRPIRASRQSPLMRILNQRSVLFLTLLSLGLIFSWLLMNAAPNYYTARAEILIENKTPYDIKKETAKLQAHDLLKKALIQSGILDVNTNRGTSQTQKWFKGLKVFDPELNDFSDDMISNDLRPALNIISKNLSVKMRRDTYSVVITYTDQNAYNAATFLNTLVKQYAGAANEKRLGNNIHAILKQLQDIAREDRRAYLNMQNSIEKSAKVNQNQSSQFLGFSPTPLIRQTMEKEKLEKLRLHMQKSQKRHHTLKAAYENQGNETHTKNTNISVLYFANTPNHPSPPLKVQYLLIGALLSLIFATLVVILAERNRRVYISGKQLEEDLNLPCYALIPRTVGDKGKPLADYVIDHPSSVTAEAIRTLRLTLKLRKTGAIDNKVIALTSSMPNEGKTTIASWLARSAAKAGENVLLIDADLRRPSIHQCLGRSNTISLIEYLGGAHTLDEAIDKTDVSGLHVIYGRAVPNSAMDLLSSDKMEALIQSLRAKYDLIIIDTPACMAVSDALAVQKYSNTLLYSVAWNKTFRETIHSGIDQFHTFLPTDKNQAIATVLTNIDLKKHIEFGYGSAVNYYTQYKSSDAA